MDSEARKKLVVPVIIFLAILTMNANTIINATGKHDVFRIVIAGASTALVLVLLIIVIRRARNGGGQSS